MRFGDVELAITVKVDEKYGKAPKSHFIATGGHWKVKAVNYKWPCGGSDELFVKCSLSFYMFRSYAFYSWGDDDTINVTLDILIVHSTDFMQGSKPPACPVSQGYTSYLTHFYCFPVFHHRSTDNRSVSVIICHDTDLHKIYFETDGCFVA